MAIKLPSCSDRKTAKGPDHSTSPTKNNLARIVKLDDAHCTCMIVDAQDYEVFTHLHTGLVKTHRCTYSTVTLIINGTLRIKRVHRIIARTPSNMVCHHRNRNSLDNRWNNLCNMVLSDHDHLHKNNNLIVKFEKFTTGLRKKTYLPVLVPSQSARYPHVIPK